MSTRESSGLTMIQMLNGPDALFRTLHRAWSTCVGLPRYDKDAWKIVESEVINGGAPVSANRTFVLLLAIEALLTQQGGKYEPVE